MKTFNRNDIIMNTSAFLRRTISSTFTDDIITLDEITNSSLSFRDRVEIICYHPDIDRRDCIQFALNCAETVLCLWQSEYPEDKRPTEAIQAVKAWLNGSAMDIDFIVLSKHAYDADDDITSKPVFNNEAGFACCSAGFTAEAIHYHADNFNDSFARAIAGAARCAYKATKGFGEDKTKNMIINLENELKKLVKS